MSRKSTIPKKIEKQLWKDCKKIDLKGIGCIKKPMYYYCFWSESFGGKYSAVPCFIYGTSFYDDTDSIKLIILFMDKYLDDGKSYPSYDEVNSYSIFNNLETALFSCKERNTKTKIC